MPRHHYARGDLAEAFRRVGLEEGDVVFCHVGLLKLGLPREIHEGSTAVDVVHGAMRDVIGDSGTLLTPTYSYSFCRGEVFDPDMTPSRVGAFGEQMRRFDGARRSLEPIFSVTGLGPSAEDLFANLPRTCFGEDCLYERLGKTDAKLCAIGVSLFYATAIHHLEEMAGVPHRYRKLFTGLINRNGNLVKENWTYCVRVLGDFSGPSFGKIETEAIDLGLCRAADVGLGRVTCIPFPDFYRLCRARLEDDPWYFAQGPPVDLLQSERERVGGEAFRVELPAQATMEQMSRALWPLPRDPVSDGWDAALTALAAQVPMTIHEYPSGTRCLDRIVPEKWACREANLETMDGRRLLSQADHPLHVVSNSLPFEGQVTRDELFDHLHVHPRLPGAIPFVGKYDERDWGLCCSRDLKENLTDERYLVVIRTDFSYDNLKVGEVIVPGDSEECFVMVARVGHTRQFNDNLSGVVVGVDVMRHLLSGSGRHYTYRLLLAPEYIGWAAYLSHNQGLIPKLRGGLFLEMLGTIHPHALRPAPDPDGDLNRLVATIVRENDPGARIEQLGQDDRAVGSAGAGVPLLTLSRVLPADHPDSPFREHHSSLDTVDAADLERLRKSRDLVLSIIDALEEDH